jgi:hypothetical protein
MPYDSGGLFSLVPSYKAITGQTIRTESHNPPLEDLASGMSSVLVRDGRAGMVGDLPMGGFKVTNMVDGSDTTDGATVGQVGTIYGTQIGDATSKATPVDADYLPLYDSAAANTLRKLTWENIKATLSALFALRTIAVTGAGLATGGGDLTTNRTLTVSEASQAQAQAGTAADVVMTPRRTTDSLNAKIYSGASAGAVDLPIGSYIAMQGPGGGVNRNAVVTPCLRTANSIDYIHSAAGDAGSALTGTWRVRGRIFDQSYLVQRVP